MLNPLTPEDADIGVQILKLFESQTAEARARAARVLSYLLKLIEDAESHG